LLGRCGPSHVARLVIPVAVRPSVDAVARGRSFAEITEKSRKVVAPLVADGDAASAIAEVFRIAWVQAALFDGAPSEVFSGGRCPVGDSAGILAGATAVLAFTRRHELGEDVQDEAAPGTGDGDSGYSWGSHDDPLMIGVVRGSSVLAARASPVILPVGRQA